MLEMDYGFSVEVLDSIIALMYKNDNRIRSGRAIKNINALFKSYKSSDQIEIQSRLWIIRTTSDLLLKGITLPEVLRQRVSESQGANEYIRDIINHTEEMAGKLTTPDCRNVLAMVDDRLRNRLIVAMRDDLIDTIDNVASGGVKSFSETSKALYTVANNIIQTKRNTTSFQDARMFDISDKSSVGLVCEDIINENVTSDRKFRTGIRRLNEWLAPGLCGEKFYMFISAANQGKTNMLVELAKDIKVYNEPLKPRKAGMVPTVLFIVMEDTEKDIMNRLFSIVTGKSMDQFGNKQAVMRELTENGFIFDEDHNINIVVRYHEYRSISTDDLYTIAKEMEDNNQELIALILDYIKRIEPSVPDPKNEKGEIHRICNELKTFATKMGVPVVSAMQLNRDAMNIIDTAKEKGQGDLVKKVGRAQIGVAIEVQEVPDVNIIIDREDIVTLDDDSPYWPTWQTFRLIRHRYSSKHLVNGGTYFAHPFDKNMGIKYVCDVDMDHSVSRDSLITALPQEDKKKSVKTTEETLEYISGKYDVLG